jgi:hypothetical protein
MAPRWQRNVLLEPEDRRPHGGYGQVDQSFAAESPKMLFHTGLTVVCTASQYAVTKDGQRFYTFQPESQASLNDLHVVLNWPQLLKK